MKWNLRDGIARNTMKGNDNAWHGIKMALHEINLKEMRIRIKFDEIRINDALHDKMRGNTVC